MVKLVGSLGFVISDFRKLTWTFVLILDIMIAAAFLFDSSASLSAPTVTIWDLLAHLKQSSSMSCEIQPIFGDLFVHVIVSK
jgi:hypothetical protein